MQSIWLHRLCASLLCGLSTESECRLKGLNYLTSENLMPSMLRQLGLVPDPASSGLDPQIHVVPYL